MHLRMASKFLYFIFIFTSKGDLLPTNQYYSDQIPESLILPNILRESGLECSNRNPKILVLHNVMLQSDLYYGNQNPHCKKSLICVVKTPTIESD